MLVGADSVSFTYPRTDRKVLDHVSFELAEGDTAALMGPSGSGKSTLLAIIGGLLKPTEGQVFPNAHLRKELLVGWVLQTVNVLGRRTALDNVALGAMARGLDLSAARARAEVMLDAVGLSDQARQRASRLSGGELQRVVIARALVGEPEIVIADEPTGQLDAAMAVQVIQALVTAKSPTTTVFVATHDPEVAFKCKRILSLRDGRISESLK